MACGHARRKDDIVKNGAHPYQCMDSLCIAYWRSILWSIDSCQIKASADQYHITISRAQVGTHRGQVFFLKVTADQVFWFSLYRRLKYFHKFLEQAKKPELHF